MTRHLEKRSRTLRITRIVWSTCLASLALPHAILADTPSALVTTAPVVQQELTETLPTFGVLEPDPDQVLTLSLPHGGLINRVWVRLGQRVKLGDRLLELITAPEARMQYLQAQSAVGYAERELQRQERLLGEQLATKAQVDAARTNLHNARSALDALKTQGVDVAENTLRSPVDGIVTQLDVSPGQRVQTDSTALLIAAQQRLIARLGIEAKDLPKVSIDTSVTITPVFVPATTVESRIREIHAMINPDTHLVEVLAPIPEADVEPLVLGTRILGRIHLATRTGLTVPRSAVLGYPPDEYLYKVRDGKAQRIPVHTGIEMGDRIEITGAVAVGDVVVTSGNYVLRDGMPLRNTPE